MITLQQKVVKCHTILILTITKRITQEATNIYLKTLRFKKKNANEEIG